MWASENYLFLYADWGDYFHHMSSITDKFAVMSMNAGETMGIGIELENINYRQETPTQIPFIIQWNYICFIKSIYKLL